MTNTTNTNRTTTAHYCVIDFSNGIPQMHEDSMIIAYTRTNAKAAKLVAEKLEINSNNVVIRELAQNEYKRNAVNVNELIDYSADYGITGEDIALDIAENYQTVVPYTAYEYFATAFGYALSENESEKIPVCKTVIYENHQKFNKGEAKTVIANEAKNNLGFYEVFAIDFRLRTKVKRYAIIDSSMYQDLRMK